MHDLKNKANELKLKYNALAAEHDTFMTRKTVAQKYTRLVKRYFDEQHMK